MRVPQKRRRKRLGTSTTPNLPVADAPNTVWAVDFQFEATAASRPIKIASIVDELDPRRGRAWLPGRAALATTAPSSRASR